MVRTFKFALVATLFLTGSCMQFEGGENSSPELPCEFEVVEFLPAPGQFINEGYTAATMAEACVYAQEALENRRFVSLGGFGGYIVVKFKTPILNSEGGYDFGIYGNSFSGSSEPGVVWVSQDANENGVADDKWFELYGSESYKSTTCYNYSITYTRTNNDGVIVWQDNRGAEGEIVRNAAHTQDYFPAWITTNEYTLTGTLLPDNSEWSDKNQEWVLHAFEWGYADNFSTVDLAADRANRLRIHDACDVTGKGADLPQIDFVKVQSATNKIHSGIGEVSTEVSGFVVYSRVE